MRIYALIFIALFVCGCGASSLNQPKGDFVKSVELKDFEPLIKEAISQESINIEELGIEDYGDKDSAEFYNMPQVKILALLKAYQKEHFKFNDTLENLAKNQSQKDFVKYYQVAQRNILLDMLYKYYGDSQKRVSYDEFVNIVNGFFAEQGQFITDFGEYFFIALESDMPISVCKELSCGHETEIFNLVTIATNLKEQNKLTDRLKNISNYGFKGYNDYLRIKSANKAHEILGDKLNARNLLAIKPSKKQIYDFVSEFELDDAPKLLEKFMDFWIKNYLKRLYMAKYAIEITLDNENEYVKSILESNPDVCIFDAYLDSNTIKICENLTILQEMVEIVMEEIANPNRKFFIVFYEKMCAIVDFGVLYDEKLFNSRPFKKPKIITNPNNTSIMCNTIKKALQ